MTLIAIVAALLLERALGQIPGWGEPALQRHHFRFLQKLLPLEWLWHTWPAVLVSLLLPLAAVWWLQNNLESPVLDLAFSAIALLLCLGPRDLADDVHKLLEARAAGHEEEANRLLHALQRGPEPDPSHRTLIGALFIQSHERLFGVLLWFFALGPFGAVLYRLVSRLPRLLREDGDTPSARVADNLHGLLAWIPARLTALLFGFSGSLDDALTAWNQLRREPAHEWRGHTWAVLAETAAASVNSETEDGAEIAPATLDQALQEVLRLQLRALLILLAFFAFFATGYWISGD